MQKYAEITEGLKANPFYFWNITPNYNVVSDIMDLLSGANLDNYQKTNLLSLWQKNGEWKKRFSSEKAHQRIDKEYDQALKSFRKAAGFELK